MAKIILVSLASRLLALGFLLFFLSALLLFFLPLLQELRVISDIEVLRFLFILFLLVGNFFKALQLNSYTPKEHVGKGTTGKV